MASGHSRCLRSAIRGHGQTDRQASKQKRRRARVDATARFFGGRRLIAVNFATGGHVVGATMCVVSLSEAPPLYLQHIFAIFLGGYGDDLQTGEDEHCVILAGFEFE